VKLIAAFMKEKIMQSEKATTQVATNWTSGYVIFVGTQGGWHSCLSHHLVIAYGLDKTKSHNTQG